MLLKSIKFVWLRIWQIKPSKNQNGTWVDKHIRKTSRAMVTNKWTSIQGHSEILAAKEASGRYEVVFMHRHLIVVLR